MATKKTNKKTKNYRIGRKVFVGVFVAIFGILGLITLSNPELRGKLTGLITRNNRIVLYTNGTDKYKKIQLYAPGKIKEWRSNNRDVATVSSTGEVVITGRGIATITAISEDKRQHRFEIEGRTKVIMFLQASQGERMSGEYWRRKPENKDKKDQFGYRVHKGKSGVYSVENHTLIYHDNPGCGICWLTSTKKINKGGNCGGFAVKKGDLDGKTSVDPGPVTGVNLLNETYGGTEDYVDLYLFFGLSGNSLNESSCNTSNGKAAIINGNSIQEKTQVSELYKKSIELYNNAANYFRSKKYNTTVFIASIYPIDYIEAKNKGKGDAWVSSTNPNACTANYVSNYKRYYANKVAELTINEKYNNKNNKNNYIYYIDMFSTFVKYNPKKDYPTNMDWIGSRERFNTGKNGNGDGQHMDNDTAKSYAQSLFNKAGL